MRKLGRFIVNTMIPFFFGASPYVDYDEQTYYNYYGNPR